MPPASAPLEGGACGGRTRGGHSQSSLPWEQGHTPTAPPGTLWGGWALTPTCSSPPSSRAMPPAPDSPVFGGRWQWGWGALVSPGEGCLWMPLAHRTLKPRISCGHSWTTSHPSGLGPPGPLLKATCSLTASPQGPGLPGPELRPPDTLRLCGLVLVFARRGGSPMPHPAMAAGGIDRE